MRSYPTRRTVVVSVVSIDPNFGYGIVGYGGTAYEMSGYVVLVQDL